MEVESEICKSKGKRWYKETVCMYFLPSFWKSRESLDKSEITHKGKRRIGTALFCALLNGMRIREFCDKRVVI